MTEAVTTVVPTAAPEAPKLTRAEKLVKRATQLADLIAKNTAEYNDIKAELDNAEKLSSVAEGSVVKIKLGRKFADKDTTRIVEATVVGVREDENTGKQYKVSYGSGFDAEVAVVNSAQIVAVGPFAEQESFLTELNA